MSSNAIASSLAVKPCGSISPSTILRRSTRPGLRRECIAGRTRPKSRGIHLRREQHRPVYRKAVSKFRWPANRIFERRNPWSGGFCPNSAWAAVFRIGVLVLNRARRTCRGNEGRRRTQSPRAMAQRQQFQAHPGAGRTQADRRSRRLCPSRARRRRQRQRLQHQRLYRRLQESAPDGLGLRDPEKRSRRRDHRQGPVLAGDLLLSLRSDGFAAARTGGVPAGAEQSHHLLSARSSGAACLSGTCRTRRLQTVLVWRIHRPLRRRHAGRRYDRVQRQDVHRPLWRAVQRTVASRSSAIGQPRTARPCRRRSPTTIPRPIRRNGRR